ncbi:hypothetical protein MYX06_02010 [Patescibacteria group bacterium AH-259-L05]|nr:hypothetical protein [Patescibacteria group bacterium AH-259-L05]
MRPKLYFGHPINTYNTDLEKKLLQIISKKFHGWVIENPSQKCHQQGCQRYRETTGRPMDYFTKEVIPKCSGGVFLAFRDGAWGAGIFKEAKTLTKFDCPIWEINIDGMLSQPILDKVNVLTIEQTRARIRNTNGTTKPY